MGFFNRIEKAFRPSSVGHFLDDLGQTAKATIQGKSLKTISGKAPGGKNEKLIGSLAAGYFTGGAAAGLAGGGLAGAAAGGALGGATAGGLNNVNNDQPFSKNLTRNALIGGATGAATYGAGRYFGGGTPSAPASTTGGTAAASDAGMLPPPTSGSPVADYTSPAWQSQNSSQVPSQFTGTTPAPMSSVPSPYLASGADTGAIPGVTAGAESAPGVTGFGGGTGTGGGPGGPTAPAMSRAPGGFDVHGDPIVGGPASATGGGDPNQLDYTLRPETQPGLNANGPATNPMQGKPPGIMDRIMGGLTGKNALRFGLPLAYTGMAALNSKKALPGEAQSSAQADQFHAMGTRDINNANAGVLQPWQDTQINTFKQQQGASAKQMMVNLGMDPSASSSMLGLNAAIEQQSQQIRGGFLTQGFNQGIQEMAIGDQAQQQYVQLQLQRRQELSSAMTNAMTTMAFMAMM